MIRLFIVFLLLLILTACQSIGPEEIRANRKYYNQFARQSELEQLLTNIVRMRYAESSYFLKMTSLTASFSLSSSLSISPSLSYSTNNPGSSSNVSRSLSASPSISYSDSPTLSFMPVESAEFATQIQAPLTLAQLMVPYSSGNYGEIHDFIFLSRLVFDRVADFSNAGSLVTAKVIEVPKFKKYYEMLRLILKLRLGGAIDIHEFVLNNVTMIHVEFYSKEDAESPEAMQLKKLLRVPKEASGFYFSDTFVPCANPEGEDLLNPNTKPFYRANCPFSRAVHVETRSILQILRFLSYSIDVPESDFEKGYAFDIKNPDGSRFDTEELYHDLFNIYSSDSEPNDTYVKVYEYHHWFYIKNSDIHSKITLTFLQRLMTLIAGSQGVTPQAAPVLTIPVNR